MVLGILSGLGLVEIVLFLLPGLFGIKAALWKAHRADWLNQIDTVAASFSLSLISMGILYIYHSGNANLCLVNYQRACSPFLTEAKIKQMTKPLESLLELYVQLHLVSLITGLVTGSVYYHGLRAGEMIPRGELWPHYFRLIRNSERVTLRKRIRNGVSRWLSNRWMYNALPSLLPNDGREEHYIRVHTVDGVAIDGRITQEGEPSQNRDIILEQPTMIQFENDGTEKILDEWTGSIYIHNQGISHIQFDDLSTADEIPAKQEGKEELEGDEQSLSDDEWEEMEQLADSDEDPSETDKIEGDD